MEKFLIRTFGRIKGRKLSDAKNNELNITLPKYELKIDEIKIKKDEKIFFEIGSGYGEHIVNQALLNKNIRIIACETYINGVISLLKKIEENNIDNIDIYKDDARFLLEKMPNNSIDKLFILFPDPWPKRKQNKKRIINAEFIDLISLKLKKNGILLFASDILNYVEWTMKFTKNKLKANFQNLDDCKKEPNCWIKTKYQEKAIKEHRECYFLEFSNMFDK